MMIQLSGKNTNFCSKMLVPSKTARRQNWKFSKVKFWPKARMQISANTKPLNLEFLRQMTCITFWSWLEKCFKVTENFQKWMCEGDWARLQRKNYFFRQSSTKCLVRNREIQQNLTGIQECNISFCAFFGSYCQRLLFRRTTGRWVASPPTFDLFIVFPNFLRY